MMIMEIHYHGLQIHPPSPHLPIPLHSRFLVIVLPPLLACYSTTVKSTKWYKRVYGILGHIIIMMITTIIINHNAFSYYLPLLLSPLYSFIQIGRAHV